jgi:uncharacterized protein YndB with AHSA1/START domain
MSAYGTLIAPDTILFERVLPGPIERAWSYITESDKRAKWLASGEMDLRVGGKIELRWDNNHLSPQYEAPPAEFADDCNGRATGRVTKLQSPRVIAFTWEDPNDPAGTSEMTFELTPRGSDVLLTLTHRKLRPRDFGRVGPGWHTHLDILVDVLAGRTVQPFWAKFMPLAEQYVKRIGVKESAAAK